MIKDVLKLYIKIENELKQIEEEIIILNEARKSPKSALLTGMPSLKSKSRKDCIGILLDSIEKLRKRYIAKKTEICDLQEKIEELMESLSSIERQLIRWRYMHGLKWDIIGEKIGYEAAHIQRIHYRALKKLENLENQNKKIKINGAGII